MDLLNRKKTGKVERPVKVLQFGEGNFLRAFVDYMSRENLTETSYL